MSIKGLFNKRFSQKMLAGVDMVKMGVMDRLSERFRGMYGQENAQSLAAAVVNRLFNETPSDPHAREFFNANRQIIERELTNLQYDDELCNIITQSIKVMLSLPSKEETTKAESFRKHVEKLQNLGIFLPDVETPMPNLFLQMVKEFYPEE